MYRGYRNVNLETNGSMCPIRLVRFSQIYKIIFLDALSIRKYLHTLFSVPTDVNNVCGKIRIRKYRHNGGQAM